jgi:xanthine dehydrogenase YagS FAD-binding subunit
MGGNGCFSVHASDLAPALIALGAQVTLAGPSGERTLPLDRFFAGPERAVQHENVLASNEVLTEVIVPEPPEGWRGTYLKARERTAGDFPLVSVAVGYTLQAGTIRQARVVLGGVAPVPWPSAAAATALEGQPLSAALADRAAEAVFAEAQPLPHNAFKVEIGRALVARAILAVGTL